MDKILWRLVTLFLFLTIAAAVTPCSASDLRVLVDLSTDMPMAEIRGEKVVQGIHVDLANALGKSLGRKVQLIPMPRTRIALELEKGSADISCHYRPEWLPGDFDWTIPFMPNGVLLITDLTRPKPKNIESVGGEKIGTVLGFSYKEVEEVLGLKFSREEAPNATLNLRKLVGGRIHHALVGELFFDYQKRNGLFKLPTHPPLVIKRYITQCAVSKKSEIKVSQFNTVLESVRSSKKLAKLYNNYNVDYAELISLAK